MKKTLCLLIAFAFLMTTLMIFSPTVLADNQCGPSETGDDRIVFCDRKNYDYLYIYSGDSDDELSVFEGITYSKETNTLTLNNALYPTCFIEAWQMGRDFTIQVIGENALSAITVWGDGYNGSLTINGTGSLSINETQQTGTAPIYVDGDYSESSLIISDTTDLSVILNRNDIYCISLYSTSLANNSFILPAANTDNIRKDSFRLNLTRRATRLNPLYLYPCTPKDNTDYPADDYYAFVDFDDETTIYTLAYDEELGETIAISRSESFCDPQFYASDFTVDTSQQPVSFLCAHDDNTWVVYRYNGDNSFYTNGDYYLDNSGYNSNNEPIYSVFQFLDSSLFETALVYIYKSSNDELIEHLSAVLQDPLYYHYTYIGAYTQTKDLPFTGLKEENEKLCYYKDGVKTQVTMLYKHTDGKWYYVKDGVVTNSTLLFKHTDGKYYYIKNGVKTNATLLVKHTDGKFYYVKNGVVTKDTLLFKHTDGKYYYIKNGVKTNATLLFKHTDGKWYYVKNGVVTKDTLLFKHTDGKFYYIKNGIKTNATLLFKHTDGKYYYVKNGVVTKSTLLFKHTDNKYYYIKNGVMTKSTLIYTFSGKKRYVKNGVWQSNFSGKAKISGKTYTIKKGNVV
ncbi:MAG: hypothetical protein J6Z00_00535 [Clostridia bacterium]|nr:hypothetical protein [Clostridia bacterium]